MLGLISCLLHHHQKRTTFIDKTSEDSNHYSKVPMVKRMIDNFKMSGILKPSGEKGNVRLTLNVQAALRLFGQS